LSIGWCTSLTTGGAVGTNAALQFNQYSGLPLIPDYSSYGGAVFASERFIGHDTELEVGARYDVLSRSAGIERIDFLRLVRSGQLDEDSCGDSTGVKTTCPSWYRTFSASIGALRQLTPAWSVKLDLSTASRPPNPDEQFLNGTAPTFPVLGLGKPDIGAETTYSTSVTSLLAKEHLNAEVSVFANRINDYINFAPALDENGKPIFDVLIRGAFPRFVTRPLDALFYGADGGVDWALNKSLSLAAQFSVVRASAVATGKYLTFVPANRLRATATYQLPTMGNWKKAAVSINGTAVDKQRRADESADFAPSPAGYFLLGAEASAQTNMYDSPVTFAVTGSNLLNQRYRDYTSLLRYFADEPGWQIAVRISAHFGAGKQRSE
jgi:iron complex outermembrane recepter protein